MNHLWKGTFYGDLRSVDVHVRHLRQKVERRRVGAACSSARSAAWATRSAGRTRGGDPPPRFGLQAWLVGALLAVGMVASLAVLLVVLPTLESSVRSDRAKREARDLVAHARRPRRRSARPSAAGTQASSRSSRPRSGRRPAPR